MPKSQCEVTDNLCIALSHFFFTYLIVLCTLGPQQIGTNNHIAYYEIMAYY
jgi:hypothetical protein